MTWIGVLLLAVAALLGWYAVLPQVDLRAMTDIGIASVLPPGAYVGFALLAAAWTFTLAQPRFPTWLVATLVVVLIVMLCGLAPSLEAVPRFSPSYRHLGVVDYITRNGAVDPLQDAYHNWPGLFSLTSSLATLAGVSDLSPVAHWAPLWLNLLYLPALYLLLDGLTDDRRLVWLAIWLFYLTDWIGQDYYSPQGVALFLYLAVMAVTVRWLARADHVDPSVRPTGSPGARVTWLLHRLLDRGPRRMDDLTPAGRAGLVAVIIATFAFTVSAHQLTPFFIVTAIGLLVLVRRVRWIGLVVLLTVIIGAWISFMSVAFLIGHFQNVAGYVGTLAESLTANLTGRLQGSDGHRFVVTLRLVTTALVWCLAAFGALRRLRAGRWDVRAVALALAPFPLFAVQAYGGEMLLRIYLFALPYVALLGAAALLPRPREELSLPLAGVVFAGSLVLMGLFVVDRYGNEPIEYFTADEVAAVRELYRVAPAGSLLVGPSGNLPWKATRYEEYRYRPQGDDTYFGKVDQLVAEMRLYQGPSYLILTRSQQAYSQLILGASPEAWTTFVRQVFETGRFTVVYENRDATVARFVPPGAAP